MTSNDYCRDCIFTPSTRFIIEKLARTYHVDLQWELARTLIKGNSLFKFSNKVSWYHISRFETLSEEFIRFFEDKVDWYWISVHQVLSENFIREFKDKVDWKMIGEYQVLSENFRNEFKDKLMAQDYELTQNDLPIGSIVKGKDAAALLHAKIISYIDNETVEVEWIATGHITSLNINSLDIISRGDFPLNSKVSYYNKSFNQTIHGTVQSYYSGVFTDQIAIKVLRTDGNTFYVKPSELKLCDAVVRNPCKEISLPEIYSFSQDTNTLKLPNDNMNPYLAREILDVAETVGLSVNLEKEMENSVTEPNPFLEQRTLAEFYKNLSKKYNLVIQFEANYLTLESITLIKNKVDWDYISKNCAYIPISFIRLFHDKINWFLLSCKKDLTNEFIREFDDKVDWRNISAHHTLSREFLIKFKDNLDWHRVYNNPTFTKDFRKEYETHWFNYIPGTYKNNMETYSTTLSDEIFRVAIRHGIATEDLLVSEVINNLRDHANWNLISDYSYQTLSQEFVRLFQDKINWRLLSRQTLSEDLIREFKDKVDWDSISQFQDLSEGFFKEFKNKLNYNCLYFNPAIPGDIKIKLFKEQHPECDEQVIKEKIKKIISESKKLEKMPKYSQKLIEEIKEIAKIHNIIVFFEDGELTDNSYQYFINNINWKWISQYRELSEDFIDTFQHKVDWNLISSYQKLSENFIRKFKHAVNWTWLTNNNNFSEDFIRENKNLVDWGSVSSQKSIPLSEDFIREFQHLVTWTRISYDQKLSESFIREFKDKVYWNNISIKQTMSKEFLLEFFNSINWELLNQNPNISDDIKNSLKRKVLDSGYEKAHQDILNQEDARIFKALDDYDFPPVTKLKIKEEKNMKEQLLDGIKELGKSCAHGAELAAVGSGQEAAYNTVVSKLGISKELSNDPAFKAAVKLIIPALLYLGSVAFEGKIPHLEYLKPILKASVEETTRENTQLIVDLVSEVGMAMYQSYMKPELPTKNVKFRIATTDYDSIKVPKLRSLAKEKGLTGYSGLKREELINLLHQTDEEESPKVMTN